MSRSLALVTINMLVGLVLLLALEASADCDSDVQEYFQGLNPSSLKLWSMQMFDSSSKSPTDGILDASFLIQLGNYDQCLAIKGPSDPEGTPRFTGQYCQFSLGFEGRQFNDLLNETVEEAVHWQKFTENILRGPRSAKPIMTPFQWAVCAPSSCSAEGVKQVADFNFNFFSSVFGARANTNILTDTCYFENDGSRVLDAESWSFIAFLAILIGWICFSTCYEYFKPDFHNSGWKIFVKAFSLNTTIKDLAKLPKTVAPGQLACLHGIRVGSIIWVMIGHSYMIYGSWPIVNFLSSNYRISEQWMAAPILNGYLSVDTFFLLSGLLTAYVPMVDLKKGRKFSIVKYYVYRYIRITVPLAVVVWYLSSLNFYLGNGPLWFYTNGIFKQICKENWWATLLYITNYFFTNCLGQAWYLCVDMQLSLLAPLVLIPLMKWPKYALAAILLLTLGSMAACFGLTYVESLPWTLSFRPDASDGARFLEVMYNNTPLRAVPYLVGMALGYVLSNKIKVPMNKWGALLGWLVSAALCLSVIYTILIPYSLEYEYNRLDAAFYAGFHKLGWSLGIAWIIWACVNGHGGVVNRILSWRYFLPLSKLSFAAYLVHQDLMQFQRGLRRTPNYLSHFEVMYTLCGYLICVLPLSMFLYLAVEAPLMILLRTAFKKKTAEAVEEITIESKKN